MKNHIVFKFLALILCACALLTAGASAAGVIAVASCGLYDKTVSELKLQSAEADLMNYAEYLARQHAILTLSNCPPDLADHYFGDSWYHLDTGLCYYTLRDEAGNVLVSTADAAASQLQSYFYAVCPEYPVVIWKGLTEKDGVIDWHDTVSEEELNNYLYTSITWQESPDGTQEAYALGFLQGPVYQVTLYLEPGAYIYGGSQHWQLLELGYAHRYNLLVVLGSSLLVFSALLVYLCCAAGKKPKCDTVQPAGLNMLPLDVYAGLVFLFACAAAIFCVEGLWDYFDRDLAWPVIGGTAVAGFLVCLLAVGFLFACAAQFKMRGGYWWRHSVTGLILLLCIKVLKAIVPLIRRAVLFFWHLLGRCFRAIGKGLIRVFEMLPLAWQWLGAGGVMVFVLCTSIGSRNPYRALLSIGFALALVLYGAYCFGILLESTRRMSGGDLNTKVERKLLFGSFRDYATALNSLAGAAEQAAREQMKSERMKAELVTNVSHDIKTPLTSIINYVDLLQKAKTPEEAAACLEVLDRQSQRLKKLIEDLMEMSKASTGNISVDIRDVDAVEAVNQALGEFSDKLAQADLTPVYNPPKESMSIRADGRLAWRVLSNLLSNTVKYALPGTRVYIDLVRLDGKVLISLKNISKEPLNVSSDELMERFVRGDASRNTEGSGLGLNIAKSLMELQGGQLQLLVDGDLFKATLLFPSS